MSDCRAQPPESGPANAVPRAAFAAIFFPPFAGSGAGAGNEKHSAASPCVPVEIAQAFSPRYERHGDDFVSMDVAGLERLMLPRAGLSGSFPDHHLSEHVRTAWQVMGEELMQAIAARGVRGQVAIAATRVTAVVLARARPGLTIVPMGDEAAALASIPIDLLTQVVDSVMPPRRVTRGATPSRESLDALASSNPTIRRKTEAKATSGTDRADVTVAVAMFKQWGLRTLGELAALPAAALTARLGGQAPVWQAIARGEDTRPLVPAEPEERFDAALELEWPIEGLEPLSFVLTRLFEPLSTRLERRDRGAATVHVTLDLVTGDPHARHLQLPSPIRDVRTLRTLALLDIESHPPAAAIDRVEVVIDPTPGRVLQHTLFTRALPTPERLSTLLARLVAVMGQDRVGAPVTVDTHRPGAFEMRPFATEHKAGLAGVSLQQSRDRPSPDPPAVRSSMAGSPNRSGELCAPSLVVSALRRCRQPVPARVIVEAGRPVRITTDRRGFVGGTVTLATGPWRTSGEWWKPPAETGKTSALNQSTAWDRDEWDVALNDGALYRVFQDRATNSWFIDGIFD
jgi:protein ImuB